MLDVISIIIINKASPLICIYFTLFRQLLNISKRTLECRPVRLALSGRIPLFSDVGPKLLSTLLYMRLGAVESQYTPAELT